MTPSATVPAQLRYPTDEDFAETNPGKYMHPEKECEAFWHRIWKRFKDKTLCYEWFKYRNWYSLKSWEYAFCQLARRENAAIARNETAYPPAGWVRGVARNYEANPAKYEKKPEKPAAVKQNSPAPVATSEEKRMWWINYYAAQAAKANASARKTG